MVKNMNISELQDKLKKLNITISARQISKIWGMDEASFSRKKRLGSEIKYENIIQLEQFLHINLTANNQENVNFTNQDIIKIPYIEWLPEEMRNPKYPDVVSRSVSIDNWGQIESLRIVAMNGNSLENYWYKIQNKDVLLIDTSETKVNADGRGVYFATSQNNTKFWIREMTEQLDGSIEFRAYPKSEIITKVYSKQQLKEVDFRVIGKVIKNVSLKLN